MLDNLWGECVHTATQLINLLPSRVIEWKTPHERLMKTKPIYDHLRIIGNLCYASGARKPSENFAERGIRCVMIGYPYRQKGYKMFDLEKRKIFVSRDVIFQEEVFPFLTEKGKRNHINTIRENMCDINDADEEEYTREDPEIFEQIALDINHDHKN